MSAEPAARRVTVVAVFALAGVAIALVIGLLAAERRTGIVGTNGADESEFVVVIRDRPYCQRGEVVPAGTAAARLLIGTYGRPGPALRVEFRSPRRGGRPVARGRLATGWSQGHVAVPVSPVRDSARATVCVEPAGGQRIAIAGQRTLDRRRQVVRIEYLDGKNESEFARLSAIADHYGRGKSRWLGSWALVLTAMLVLSSLLLAARWMAAEGRA